MKVAGTDLGLKDSGQWLWAKRPQQGQPAKRRNVTSTAHTYCKASSRLPVGELWFELPVSHVGNEPRVPSSAECCHEHTGRHSDWSSHEARIGLLLVAAPLAQFLACHSYPVFAAHRHQMHRCVCEPMYGSPVYVHLCTWSSALELPLREFNPR